MSEHRKAYNPDPHRLLPQSPDSEKGLLSSFLISPSEIGAFCASKGVRAEWFAVPSHGIIYRRLMEMWANEEPIDFITLTQKLRALGDLDKCGGAAEVTQLFTFLPTAANAGKYVETLEELWMLRGGCYETAAGMEKCYDAKGKPAREVIVEIVGRLENVIRVDDNKMRSITKDAVESIKERMLQRGIGGSVGTKTGMSNWDHALGGLMPSRYIVLGARPKIGKTSWCEQVAQNIMLSGGAVLIFERDMSVDDMVARMACRAANVVFEDFDHGKCDQHQLRRVSKALADINPELLRIHSPHNMTSEELGVITRREIRSRKIKAVFLDVFQKMRIKGHDRTEGLTAASHHIRDHVNDYGAPWVVCAHINRDAEKTGRPTTSQFRYCDALFGDCDIAALMWSRENPKEEAKWDEGESDLEDKPESWKRQKVYLSMDANRGGNVGDLTLYFDRPHMTFYQTRDGEF